MIFIDIIYYEMKYYIFHIEFTIYFLITLIQLGYFIDIYQNIETYVDIFKIFV